MFTFDQYSLRPVTEKDRERITREIAADPDHAGKVAADFFVKSEPGFAECMVLEDATGEPVFYFRQERALRVHIQFPATTTATDKERIREGLQRGFGWLLSKAQQAGFRELIFESSFAPLIRFCTKRFRFKQSPNELVCRIAPVEVQMGQVNDARRDHHSSEQRG